jgi:hypothetical protein
MATKKIAAKSAKGKSKGKAKAAKVARKARGEGGEFDRTKLDTGWTAKQVRERRAMHHKVKVGGKEYGSVFKAFEALKLPIWQHQAFRKVLKLSKRAPFKYGAKTYQFALAS